MGGTRLYDIEGIRGRVKFNLAGARTVSIPLPNYFIVLVMPILVKYSSGINSGFL